MHHRLSYGITHKHVVLIETTMFKGDDAAVV
jgi:hypothetical protein